MTSHTTPTTIRVERGPDHTATIINPHHKGAVTDWKSTAHDLAEQLLAVKKHRDDIHKDYQKVLDKIGPLEREVTQAHSLLHNISKHWTFAFQRSWIRDVTKSWLTDAAR